MDNPKILVVDDNPFIRKLLKHRLEANNYRVVEAATGEETIELTEKEAPALILLDISLPDRNGFEVYKYLQENGNEAPVIFQTASHREDLPEAVSLNTEFETDRVFFINKKPSSDELLQVIGKALRKP